MSDRVMAVIVVVIVVAGAGAGYLLLSQEPAEVRTVNMTITASGGLGDVVYGVPERGFWGYENGAINWKPLPINREYCFYDEEADKRTTLEYWFRERFYNGTEWVYSNHGPFFVYFPQSEYYEEIALNNYTVYIEMKEY